MAKTQEQYEMELAYADAKNQQSLQQQQALAQLKQQAQMQQLLGGGGGNEFDLGDGFGSSVQPTKIPLLDAFDQYTRQETLQNPWSIAANAINKTALPKSDNFWENLGGNALQGLLGGGLRSFGEQDILGQFQDEIAPSLKGMYPELNLDGMKDLDSGRMQLINAVGNAAHSDKLEELGIKAYGRKGSGPRGRVLGDGTPQTMDELYDYYKNELGLGETTTKARMAGIQKQMDDTLNKGIPGAYDASTDAKTKARLIRRGIEDFGATGPIYGPAKKGLYSVLDATGLDNVFGIDTDVALRGAQAFDVSAWKEAFLNKMPGAITEKELDKMLNLGGGISSTTATNERLAVAAEKLSVIAEAYAKAQEKYLAANGGNMTGFPGFWNGIKTQLMDEIPDVGPSKTPGAKLDIRTRLKQIRGG